jgi:hypothetical protein
MNQAVGTVKAAADFYSSFWQARPTVDFRAIS